MKVILIGDGIYREDMLGKMGKGGEDGGGLSPWIEEGKSHRRSVRLVSGPLYCTIVSGTSWVVEGR
jgi:hypothetical protein